MEQSNEKFLSFHSNERKKNFESFLVKSDDIINRRDDDDFLNPRNEFYERIDCFSNQGDDIFNQKNGFLNQMDYFNNQKEDFYYPRVDCLNIKDDLFSPRKDLLSKDYFSESDNVDDSFKKDFDVDWSNSKETDINLGINKNEENAKVIKKIEIRNNNSTTKETPFISQESISQSKSEAKSKTLGRKTNKNKRASNEHENSSHGIYSEDNITVKIQTHYINFIISVLNCIFPHFNLKKKLRNLDKQFKINIKKDNVGSLNGKTIGEIISNKISLKYTTIEDKINANKNIYEEIKNIPILNKILSENYLVFFKKFYYNSDSYINLKDYGLNKNIKFTKKVENFKHLLEKNKKRGNYYIMLIKEYTRRKYLPGLMFICHL